MDDLSGLSWDSNIQAQPLSNGANYKSLRPTPPNGSRQNTPLSSTQSGRNTPLSTSNGSARPVGQDSFSNLLPSKKTTQPSLQERQKQLIEERARQQAEQQKRHQDQFKLDDSHFWEGLGRGSGRSTPGTNERSSPNPAITEDEDDILAAFNASAPVDSSSHFPPPQRQGESLDTNGLREASRSRPPTSAPAQNNTEISAAKQSLDFLGDDDPFGLEHMAAPATAPASRPRAAGPAASIDDDDVLGILGKPVSEVSRSREAIPTAALGEDTSSQSNGAAARDQAIAELVDMGFPLDRSREALDQTETGVDVQSAVGWLLNQAHQKSKSESRGGKNAAASYPDRQPRNANAAPAPEALAEDRNAWLGQKVRPSRNDSRSPGTVENELAQRATEISSNLFKSANSLWKSSQKRMQKAMAEFQHEGESDQPRWMRESQPVHDNASPVEAPRQHVKQSQQPLVTDEAMMLDAQRAPAPRQSATRNLPTNASTAARNPQQGRSSLVEAPRRDLASRPAPRPAERISKQAIEEQSAQAYVSPARRRKPQPQAPPSPTIPKSEPELDIFSSAPIPQPTARPSITTKLPSRPENTRPPPVTRPKVPQRQIPSTPPSAVSQSSQHRLEGTAAFKRGDYASAHASYTSSITPLPPKHPITIILYSNRALTSLKTGDPKAAIDDADQALTIIGVSRGEDEFISLGPGEPDKPMKEFYGKALMRKAEALEQMEKWTDAAKIWREAVEAGVGGALSIQGRNRCEKAAGTTPASAAAPSSGRPSVAPAKKSAPAKPKMRSAAADLVGGGAKESEAVTRLRAANAAATAASDEAFALNDFVEARLNSWKNGKEGNLRALLASLDTVLWEGAGWTKVGMGDLVLTNKCKIVYMKAIAKCHPDKIPTDASTEQRMISASVFATLNEAWDKFKRDNGL